ncbi:Oidioi.mRNA.OKI2018_I69.PAR.g11723.t2.cds [Oikopleura dioica]|uniref:Oidioi.mRNA.OKI2018_I69.PAR.g11723.t2.cds n=1 Tax=Oikopleura dioica TaxID=34765 RepID=A0ABN7RX02_OIKDI|nr:Oidioi.mRNA.OKI2018_I69.PAR.g11723.t2.cds [Oikopleura dioica]
MNRVLDDFMEKNLQPEPEIEDEEIEVYKEVANLADDLRLTVLELEKEGKIDRSTLLEYIQPDTIMFYRETFSHFPHSERSAFAEMKQRLRDADDVLTETLRRRNDLEKERMLHLDQIAELKVALARAHSTDNEKNELGMNPLYSSSPAQNLVNQRILSPDEGIEARSEISESCTSTRPSSASSPPMRNILPVGIDMGGIPMWDRTQAIRWLQGLDLGQYADKVKDGSSIVSDPEKSLGMTNPFHKKKLRLAIRALDDELKSNNLGTGWVCNWLEEIGLPEYKKSFHEHGVDGRVLNLLTMEELLSLGVSSQIHYLSIKRGIQVLRQSKFNPHTMVCRPGACDQIERWSIFRIMDWLRSIELSEYAPNLRGSGVHGGLIALEPGFGHDHLANLLDINPKKTLLRKHLQTSFNQLLSDQQFESKRDYILRNGMPMPLTARLKRKKKAFFGSKKSVGSAGDDELVCPLNLGRHDDPSRRPSINVVPP